MQDASFRKIEARSGRTVLVSALGEARVELSIASPLGSVELHKDERIALAKALIEDLDGYNVRYVKPIPEGKLSCGCKIDACICDFS